MRDAREYGDLIRRGLALGARQGLLAAAQRARVQLRDRRGPSASSYARWRLGERRGFRGAGQTRISVLVPVRDPEPAQLDALVASLRAQGHADWELIFVDDASRSASVRRRLAHHVARDVRVRSTARATPGGISKATNGAAATARGDVLLLLDHDDVLGSDLLAHLGAAFKDPCVDLAYSDHDELTPSGVRIAPRFKPGPSPWFALGLNYVTHPLAIRRELFDALGGLRASFDGGQDHDLLLRAWERARRVVHLPILGYHWRRRAASVASSATAKPWAYEAGRRAVEAAARRRGLPLQEVRSGVVAGVHELRLLAPDRPRRVRLVLHGQGAGLDDWERAVRSTPRLWNVAEVHRNRWPERAGDEALLLLDATARPDPESLERLARWAELPGVGAMGAPAAGARRRHLGWSLDRRGVATPICPGLARGALGPQLLAAAPREVAALANGVVWLARPSARIAEALAGRPVDTAGVLVASAASWLGGRAVLHHPGLAPSEAAGRGWQPKRVHLSAQPGAELLLEGLPEEVWAGVSDRFCPRHELLTPLGLPTPEAAAGARAGSAAAGFGAEHLERDAAAQA